MHNTVPAKLDDNEKKKEERYYNVDKKPQFMDFDSTAN